MAEKTEHTVQQDEAEQKDAAQQAGMKEEDGVTETVVLAARKLAEAARILNRWAGRYTHVFVKPFQWQGKTYERLTFDWETLRGADCISAEAAVRRRDAAPTLHTGDYPTAYLEELAARSCTERDEDGKRVLGADALQHMPAQDCLRICREARVFLANLAL